MELLDRPLDELMAEARAVRERAAGRLVTYSPKVFVPLTKLCRDVCHYCTFARPPRRGERAYMTIDEVLEVARAGERAGCREALFTLGDKPELRYRAARDELAALGFGSTLEYLAAAAARRARGDVAAAAPQPRRARRGRLRAAAARRRLDGADARDHLGAALGARRAALRLARQAAGARGSRRCGSPGEARVPFTTGILIGIGETREERLEALRGDRRGRAARAGGDRPELPRQAGHADGGRARAAARGAPVDDRGRAADPAAGGRGAGAAEPDRTTSPRLLDAGIDDWGGVSPVTIDHVNPEAPWPELELLRAATESRGLELAPRLTVYPGHSSARVDRRGACCRACSGPPTRSASRARTRGRRARRGEVPFVVRRDPLPLDIGRRAGRGRDRPRSSARAARSASASSPPPTRCAAR